MTHSKAHHSTDERHFEAWSILINGALYLALVGAAGLATGHHMAAILAAVTAGFVYILASFRLYVLQSVPEAVHSDWWFTGWCIALILGIFAGFALLI